MESATFISKFAALLIFSMSFSYTLGANPPIDYPRMLIQDTQQFQPDGSTRAYIFEDQEILSFTAIVGNVYQSTMQYDPPITVQVPPYPVSYIRIAAYLLNSLAANTARLTGILQILDVKLDMKSATKALQDQAKAWLDIDDNTGAFVVIEQVQFDDDAGFKDRFFREIQRQSFL